MKKRVDFMFLYWFFNIKPYKENVSLISLQLVFKLLLYRKCDESKQQVVQSSTQMQND